MKKKKENLEEDANISKQEDLIQEKKVVNTGLVPVKSQAEIEAEMLEKSKVIAAMTYSMHKKEKILPYKSAVIANGREQPIILSSNETFTDHFINFGAGVSMQVPTKMIPYLIETLTNLYQKNGIDHFKGDQKALDEFTKKEMDSMSLEYFDLNDVIHANGTALTGDCEDTLGEVAGNVHDKLKDLFKRKEDFKTDLSNEEMIELIDDFKSLTSVLSETKDSLSDKKLSREEQLELKSRLDSEMNEHLKEIELKLTGKIEDKNTVVTLDRVKEIFEKHGEKAAMEEWMRLPAEQRDLLLEDAMKLFKNNNN